MTLCLIIPRGVDSVHNNRRANRRSHDENQSCDEDFGYFQSDGSQLGNVRTKAQADKGSGFLWSFDCLLERKVHYIP